MLVAPSCIVMVAEKDVCTNTRAKYHPNRRRCRLAAAPLIFIVTAERRMSSRGGTLRASISGPGKTAKPSKWGGGARPARAVTRGACDPFGTVSEHPRRLLAKRFGARYFAIGFA